MGELEGATRPEPICRAFEGQPVSVDAAVRFQIGGTTLPRLTAITSITIPVVVHNSSASTDDSTPKRPPVSRSGPLMQYLRQRAQGLIACYARRYSLLT